MPEFDYAAAIRTRPSDAEIPSAFGRFSYRESPTKKGAVIPDPAWAARNLVEIDLTQFAGFPGTAKRLWMHRTVAPVFVACMREASALGLLARLHEYNGCYVARHMTWNPKRPLSCHSWGIAVDFDASTSGYGDATPGISPEFVRFMEERGWCWGGRWTGDYVDGMHFQWTDPLPGTNVQPWQDAKLRQVGESKPVPAGRPRRVMIEGQTVTQGRYVCGGVTVAIMEDGSAYLRPSTKAEADGQIVQPPAPGGISGRVTLLDQADQWVPFSGRAVYQRLMLNLDGKTGDLWIRRALPEELRA